MTKDEMIKHLIKKNHDGDVEKWDSSTWRKNRIQLKRMESMLETSEWIENSELLADKRDWNAKIASLDIRGLEWLVTK